MSQPAPRPSWKEEVNRRLEAHKSRKGLSAVEDVGQSEERSGVSGRAARAAARVAARFSQAPSYGEMQAAEARAALRNAEAATRAALEAQAAARAALENLERMAERSAEVEEQNKIDPLPLDPPEWATERVASAIAGSPTRCERETEWPPVAAAPASAPFPANPRVEGMRLYPVSHSDDFAEDTPDEWVEPAKPIHANLIQFPREIVATRRIRPRLAESSCGSAGEQYGQLSIFEVDPASISTEAPAAAFVETAGPTPSWSGSDWRSAEYETEFDDYSEPVTEQASSIPAIHLAPLSLRALAATLDLALVIAMACAAALGIAGHMPHGVSAKTAEIAALVSFLLIAVFYQTFFLLTTMTTPGMMYAGISLCTFDDEFPTRRQLRDRIVALLISFLPVGLGMAWSMFDEDRLSWHDRLSHTYQRRC